MGEAAQGATFLLVINAAIGLCFAIVFLGLSWRDDVRLGKWCAGGFVSASATVLVEAAAPFISPARLVSFLSFSLLLLALTLIVAGLAQHYAKAAKVWPFLLLFVLGSLLNLLVAWDIPRSERVFGIVYQTPFALMCVLGAWIIFRARRRGLADIILAGVLCLCAFQFLAKGGAGFFSLGLAPDVHDYVVSTYAYYSQTMGAVLSIMLGLSLLGVILVEVIARTMQGFQSDPLSGVLTRAAFLSQARRGMEDAGPGMPVGLVMADIDYFKSINDRFGHAAGDEVIRRFGAILIENLKAGGLAGRVGGEEFALFMPGADMERLRDSIESVRAALCRVPFDFAPPEVRFTVSCGGALMNEGETVEVALRRADIALYAAKAEGRDTYILSEGDREGEARSEGAAHVPLSPAPVAMSQTLATRNGTM